MFIFTGADFRLPPHLHSPLEEIKIPLGEYFQITVPPINSPIFFFPAQFVPPEGGALPSSHTVFFVK